jgi:hypothetical protein
MLRQLLGVTVLGLALSACSSTPIDPSSEQSSTESDSGSISFPLTAQGKDVTYRLRLASFVITGETLAKARVVKPLDDATVHNEKLPVGSYSILLQKGWVLEKRGIEETAYTLVKGAKLVTPNPVEVGIDGHVVAQAFFGFSTTSGDVTLGDGSVDIRIGVQDCAAYDTYTAQLAELTVQCLGTLDPKAYEVSKDGYLTPTFQECTVKDRLRPIRQLLSLQLRSARLPFVQQCMAGRYDAFLQKFAASGVNVCPAWKLDRVVNPISADVLTKVIPSLPVIPENGLKDDGQPRSFPELKVNSVYSVTLPPNTPPQDGCKTPAECAMKCAEAFPGFALDTAGEASVVTDPVAWLLDTTYASSTADPYLKAGYYHPMSWYGGVPGVQFGDYARFEPCGVNAAGVAICEPERCSYYTGVHKLTRLQKDCIIEGDLDTCNSYCGPPK